MKTKRKSLKFLVLIAIIHVVGAIVFIGCTKKPSVPPTSEVPPTTPVETPAPAITPDPAESTQPAEAVEPVKPETPKVPDSEAVTLQSLMNLPDKYWNPILTNWYGKDAPDFAIDDLSGKTHKLSDYKGKDVIVVFWATWCPTCRAEIPHLKELRTEISSDKLQILAVSNESKRAVQSFVNQAKMNYTVVLMKSRMPAPFSMAEYLPTSFFVDKQGKIKLIAEGYVSKEQTRAILDATK